jgi:putative FmdB family regulatory protein
MPTYDYKCDACGHAFEVFQSMSAPPVRKCPKCKKSKVKRLIGTGAGLIFKGSGFYITDYRDQGYKDKAKAESGATTSDASKSDPGKTDASKTDGAATPAKSDGAAANSDAAKPATSTDTKPAAPSEKPKSKRSAK